MALNKVKQLVSNPHELFFVPSKWLVSVPKSKCPYAVKFSQHRGIPAYLKYFLLLCCQRIGLV